MSDVIAEEIHLELEVGFLTGDRSLGDAPFSRVDIDERPIADLDDPFAATPLRDAFVVGPRVEARVVAPPLRTSVGWQRPYPDWQPVGDARERDGAGTPVISSVRALRTDEIVLGIGLEAPTGLVAPFVDLVGKVHVSKVSLAVDGVAATYRSESFSLGPRGGVRMQVSDHTFVQVAGEWIAVGPGTWGATVGLGVAAF
jgi:hypothetical protein